MLLLSTEMKKMPSRPSRICTIRISMVRESESPSARRVASSMDLATALPVETTVADPLAEMTVHPRHAITAASLVISPESAVSPAASADQDLDLTSKNLLYIRIVINQNVL